MSQANAHRKLRIAIATLGRFHVLDLARELALLGHEVRFYSYVPRRRAERFGLPRECHVALLPFLFPLVALSRAVRIRRISDWLTHATHWAADWAVTLRLKPCDVFIGMSGVYLTASLVARQRYGATIIVERGSRHILSQKRILDDVARIDPGCAVVPNWVVKRELSQYASSDLISVPARHVEDSFVEEGTDRSRLFRNPYGVDLSMFNCQSTQQRDTRTLLFVGSWSLRKGVDVLARAIRTLTQDVRVIHVGPKGDAPFPTDSWFQSIGPVPQWSLAAWYSTAIALVLPSREEGLALVQMQALASGCSLIVTDRTGGADLELFVAGLHMIDVVPAGDVAALADCIDRRLESGPAVVDATALRERLRRSLSWRAYARRYADRLATLQDTVGTS